MTIQHTEPPLRLTMTIPEAAKAIGVSRAFIYSLIDQGKFRTLKIGKRRLVEPSELQRFLKTCRVP